MPYYLLPWSAIQDRSTSMNETGTVKLPKPQQDNQTSIEEAIKRRRSIREYKDEPLTLAELSQLLWAAQGITGPAGLRTAPSAGALYPLEVYVVIGDVVDLPAGVYKYNPRNHQLVRIVEGDKRSKLSDAALSQEWVEEAAVDLVISAVFERTTQKYGERGIQYVHIEVGAVAQNIYLQAVPLNLGTVTVGAFDDDQVKEILNIPDEEDPLLIMPVGKK